VSTVCLLLVKCNFSTVVIMNHCWLMVVSEVCCGSNKFVWIVMIVDWVPLIKFFFFLSGINSWQIGTEKGLYRYQIAEPWYPALLTRIQFSSQLMWYLCLLWLVWCSFSFLWEEMSSHSYPLNSFFIFNLWYANLNHHPAG